jgi:hypothetical protein
MSIRQHTPAYVSIRQHTCGGLGTTLDGQMSIRQHTPAYVSICQHTSNIRIALQYAPKNRLHAQQHTSAYVRIRQHTDCPAVCAEESPPRAAAYVSIRRRRWKGRKGARFFFFAESRRRLLYSVFQESDFQESENPCALPCLCAPHPQLFFFVFLFWEEDGSSPSS